MSLYKIIDFKLSDIDMSHIEKINPTEIVAFVASWCPHSKNACNMLKNIITDNKPVYYTIYAVDKEAFVDTDLLVKTDTSLEHINKYKKTYDKIMENKYNVWQYPHIFMKDTKWHYIGGEDALSAITIKKTKSYEINLKL